MRKIFVLFCMINTFSLFAQQKTASLSGHVIDATLEEHLPGVVLLLEEVNKSVVADETGHFKIEKLKAGSYTLVTQYVGYKQTRQHVMLSPIDHKNLTLYLYPEDLTLDEVAVVASAKSLNRKISPVVVNQLTTETFEATNSTSLAVGLNYMPGLRVENNCQNCGTQEVRVNGLKGEYSQILIDGQAIFSSLSQMYGLEQLPTNMIEQVEVIRGGGSALHGSTAIGGVLNIKTKEPDKNSYEAKYTLSMIDGKEPDNILSLNSSFVDRAKTSGVSLFANMRRRQPWDANGDGFSEIGKNKSRSIGFRSFANPSTHDKLTLEYHNIAEYRRGGDNINKPPHEAMIAETTDYDINSGSLGYTHLSDNNKRILRVNGSFQHIGRDSYYGEGKDLNGYGTTSEIAASGTLSYEVNSDFLWFMPAKFTVGFTQNYVNLEDSIHNRNLKQILNTSCIFVQNEWRDDKLTLILGTRIEKHNKLKNINLIPRASFRYQLKEGMNLRVAYSMGYRAPEITASDLDIPIIGGKTTITILGENLQREYSNSINGGVDYTFYNENIYSYFLLEGFYSRINRVFIEEETGVDALGNMIKIKKNGDGAYVYGVNLEGNIQPLNWLDIQAGLTLQKSEYTKPIRWSSETYVAPVKKILKSPDTYGFLTAKATPCKSYAVSLSAVYTGSMLVPHFAGAEGVDQDITTKSKSFIDAILKCSYFVNLYSSNKVELFGGVQNIFNQMQKDYDKGAGRDSEYVYGPSLPRTYFIGLKLSSL